MNSITSTRSLIRPLNNPVKSLYISLGSCSVIFSAATKPRNMPIRWFLRSAIWLICGVFFICMVTSLTVPMGYGIRIRFGLSASIMLPRASSPSAEPRFTSTKVRLAGKFTRVMVWPRRW